MIGRAPRQRDPSPSHAVGLAMAVGALLLLAACGPLPSPTPSLLPVTPVPTLISSGTPGVVTIDPSLLSVLPANVAGVPVVQSPEGDADAAGNQTLFRVAEAAVAAVAVDTTTADLAVALVVRLRSGAFSDLAFRSWRDNFDAGACAAAGGALGNGEARIGGRTVFVGSCSNGLLHTYHVWIADKNLLVSVSSVGDRKLGENLVANLKP